MGSSDLGPARWWCGTCCTRGSSVTQKEVSPDFWNLDSVKSSLPEPTFLLSFLTLSFSISSTLHLFPTHDDTILPTYPIQLFLLPIITTRSTPKPAARGVQPQPAAVRGVQPQPVAGRGLRPHPAASRGVQSQPAAASGVQSQHAEQEDAKGAL